MKSRPSFVALENQIPSKAQRQIKIVSNKNIRPINQSVHPPIQRTVRAELVIFSFFHQSFRRSQLEPADCCCFQPHRQTYRHAQSRILSIANIKYRYQLIRLHCCFCDVLFFTGSLAIQPPPTAAKITLSQQINDYSLS